MCLTFYALKEKRVLHGNFFSFVLALLKMNRAAAHGYERSANNRRIQVPLIQWALHPTEGEYIHWAA